MREEETGVKKSKAAKEPDQPPCCEEPTAMCQSPILHSSSSASSNIPSAKVQAFCSLSFLQSKYQEQVLKF